MTRHYSNLAGEMALTAGVGTTDTSLTLDTVTGLPGTTPYTLVLDVGSTSSEEVVTVTAVAGTTVTVTRGQDGTPAQAHSAGAVVRHMYTARDAQDSQDHIAASSGVHGATGTVVGTSDTQTLDNKTFKPSGSDHTALKVQQGDASYTSELITFLDATGATLGSIGRGFSVDSADVYDSVLSAAYGKVVNLTVPGDVDGVLVTLTGAGSAFRVNNGTSDTFTVDKSGNVVGNSFTGSVTGNVTGNVTGDLTGSVSGATSVATGTLTTTGNATVGGNAAVTGDVTAANLPQVPAALAGKNASWGLYTFTTNTSGVATITHGLGFTPIGGAATVVSPVGSLVVTNLRDFTSTQATLQLYYVSTSAPVQALSVTVFIVWGE